MQVLSCLSADLDIPKQFKDGVPNEVTSIIRQLMIHDPDGRPTAIDIKKDEYNYLKKLKKKAIKKPFIETTLTKKYIKQCKPLHVVLSMGPKEPDCTVGIEHLTERAPEPFQIKCPICMEILKKPHQTECCGTDFCKECIERIKMDKKPCPTCKHRDIGLFLNIGLQKELYSLRIKCIYHDRGCRWIGELGQLDSHFNSNPCPEKQLEGCKYVQLTCTYCAKKLRRSEFSYHQNDRCKKRPFKCDYCKTYKSNYRDVVNKHWPICTLYPIECSSCGEKVPRHIIEDHMKYICSAAGVMCNAGCKEIIPSKDMLAHLIDVHLPEKLKEVFHQANRRQEKQLEDERSHTCTLQDENQRLKYELKLASQAKKHVESKSHDLKDFQASAAFNTEPRSHKFLIRVPPKFIQIECPICQNILKEPHQVSCCGTNFCHLCIQQVIANKDPCPGCESLPVTTVYNKGRSRAVRQLSTHCINKEKGCNWTGEYYQLDEHLNPNKVNCCEFIEIQCKDCEDMIKKFRSQIHKKEECQKRSCICSYCKSYKSTYDDITEHWHVCDSYLVLCPKKCGTKIQRKYLTKHLQSQCSRKEFESIYITSPYVSILLEAWQQYWWSS